MNLLSNEQFIMKMGRAMKPQMSMGIYYGNHFQCACGQYHDFNEHISILAEGTGQTIIVQCPDEPEYFSLIKIKMKWLVVFKSFEYIAGHKTDNPEELIIGYRYSFSK